MNRKEFTHEGGTHIYKAKSCHCYVPSLGEYDFPVVIICQRTEKIQAKLRVFMFLALGRLLGTR